MADYRYIVAHEIAHQWWYCLVGNNQITEPWLDESLATYSAAIYLEDVHGPETAADLIDYWRGRYGGRTAGEPPVDSSALDFAGWGSYRETVYIRGALFMDALREEIGDARFNQLLQVHVSRHRFDWATTDGLLDLAQEVASSDLEPVISRWFE